jgi:hypothetical protein
VGVDVGKMLSGENLLNHIQNRFAEVPDHRDLSRIVHSMPDVLMSGFAIFSLKFPSLLKFEEEIRAKRRGRSNLQTIYGVESVPSDSRMREVLDEVEPEHLRKPIKSLFALGQRFKALEKFEFLNGYYLMSVDGSGYFVSDKIHCDLCHRTVNKRDNSVRYHHEMLAASIVHPEQRCVLPLCPEPIHKRDSKFVKSDSEQSGMKRFIEDFRREHPHLKVILLADALHATGPLIKILKEKHMSFILSVKPGSHPSVFKGLTQWEKLGKTMTLTQTEIIGEKIKKTRTRNYHFTNGILINHLHLDIGVNILDFQEVTQWTSPKGEIKKEVKKFTWVTDIPITKNNAEKIMQGGRTRWKIENETFNSLKNLGYEFEHNFGHGYKNLSTNMALLMMLAFLFDQLQELSCSHFRGALAYGNSRRIRLWEKMKAAYEMLPEIPGWTFFMRLIYDSENTLKVHFNTS